MEGGPPCFPRDSSCPHLLRILLASTRFHLHDSHILRFTFPRDSVSSSLASRSPYPHEYSYPQVWPPPLSLAATYGISFDFFSSAYLDVSLRRVPLITLSFSWTDLLFFITVVSQFGYLWFIAYLQLPKAFRSLSRPSSAPDAKAFSLCSSSLELPSP